MGSGHQGQFCVIGSGPSGMYAVEELLKQYPQSQIVILEKLPFPYGLVRYGVSPDHQKIKNVSKIYDRLLREERVSYCGGLEYGKDVTLNELKVYFDAVIFATGCSKGRSLGLKNEESSYCYTASDFVFWYNGHPEHKGQNFAFPGEKVVIVGQGNVAFDVARLLVKEGEELQSYDIPDYALSVFNQNKVKDVYLLGRRGLAMIACSPAVLKELVKIEGLKIEVEDEHIEEAEQQIAQIEDPLKQKEAERNYNAIKWIKEETSSIENPKKRLHLNFHESVKKIDVKDDGLSLRISTKEGERVEDISRLIYSIGYQGEALPEIPFNEKKGVFDHKDGCINERVYTAGWIKRGAQGVIGTNKLDSQKTVARLIESCQVGTYGCQGVEIFFKKYQEKYISKEKWFSIDKLECENGSLKGKIREKFLEKPSKFC